MIGRGNDAVLGKMSLDIAPAQEEQEVQAPGGGGGGCGGCCTELRGDFGPKWPSGAAIAWHVHWGKAKSSKIGCMEIGHTDAF